MIGREIVKVIEDRRLASFDVFVSFIDGYNVFPNVITIPVTGLIETEDGVHLFGEEDSNSPLSGFELINVISDNNLIDSEIPFTLKSSNSNVKSVSIVELGDIGYSNNEVHFDGEVL